VRIEFNVASVNNDGPEGYVRSFVVPPVPTTN
jgi:hypothetical protein